MNPVIQDFSLPCMKLLMLENLQSLLEGETRHAFASDAFGEDTTEFYSSVLMNMCRADGEPIHSKLCASLFGVRISLRKSLNFFFFEVPGKSKIDWRGVVAKESLRFAFAGIQVGSTTSG